MISSSVFDVTVNTFGDFVNEVFSGTDENQKAKLRKMLTQFTKISRKRKPDGQINSVQTKKRRVSDVEHRGDASSLDKGVHLISKGCNLAKFSQFFREIGSFLPFSGNLWGARAPQCTPPYGAPVTIIKASFWVQSPILTKLYMSFEILSIENEFRPNCTFPKRFLNKFK